MARSAQRDQIFRAVMPKATSRQDVMNLEVLGSAAMLATPIVPCKNLLAQSFVLAILP
jgi:hypothetical protein